MDSYIESVYNKLVEKYNKLSQLKEALQQEHQTQDDDQQFIPKTQRKRVLTRKTFERKGIGVKGITINAETTQVEELHRIGPGGHFLDSETTLSHFRDYWFPSLLDRQIRDRWLKRGGKPLGQRLNERVKEIIAEHRAPELSAEQSRKLREIMARAK